MYGKTHSEETKNNYSKKRSGVGNAMYGKNHTEESKNQIKATINGNKTQCIYCNKHVIRSSHTRWHGENCKQKENLNG